MGDDEYTRPAATRRSVLAATAGVVVAGALASVPTAAAQPMEWTQAGANRAAQHAAQLWGPEGERVALLAGDSAVRGVEGSMADVPEEILTELVCDGIAYGSVMGTLVGGISQVYGVLDDAHLQSAPLGASSAALTTAGQYPDVNWSASGVFRRSGVGLLPEDEAIIEDRGPIMRCPTMGATTGALVRASPFIHPEQPPELTRDAAANGAAVGVTFIAQTGTDSCDLIHNESSYAATYY